MSLFIDALRAKLSERANEIASSILRGATSFEIYQHACGRHKEIVAILEDIAELQQRFKFDEEEEED